MAPGDRARAGKRYNRRGAHTLASPFLAIATYLRSRSLLVVRYCLLRVVYQDLVPLPPNGKEARGEIADDHRMSR